MSQDEEFFLSGSILSGNYDLDSLFSSSTSSTSSILGLDTLPGFDDATYYNTGVGDQKDEFSDVEEFSVPSKNMDENDSKTGIGFGKLADIDGDMHITGVSKHSRHKIGKKSLENCFTLLTLPNDDDDFYSDDESKKDTLNIRDEKTTEDDESTTINTFIDDVDGDVANMRAYTTIDALLHPPGLPQFAVIKASTLSYPTLLPSRLDSKNTRKKNSAF